MRKTFFSFLALLIATSATISTTHATVIEPSNTIVVPATEPKPEEVKNALDEFKALSKKERKERLKDVKKEIKAYKKAKRSGDAPSDNMVLLCILAILLPPLAVYLHQGEINTKFWISLLLTLLFWIPGVIYAFIVILGADQ
ncbi:MAG TPA: YqaE/Pmp3 family membrane protein [Chitinophagaceae bacterium]